jgi:hypothetical protein
MYCFDLELVDGVCNATVTLRNFEMLLTLMGGVPKTRSKYLPRPKLIQELAARGFTDVRMVGEFCTP